MKRLFLGCRLFTLIALFWIAGVFLSSPQANAATLNVAAGTGSTADDNLCQLDEAIVSINAFGDNPSDCIHSGSAYGTNDTINLPSGTITLTADLPTIGGSDQNISIIGLSESASIIDADNNIGFNSIINNKDQIYQNFKIIDAKNFAIATTSNLSVTLDNIEVVNSGACVDLRAVNVIVTNSYIHNCDNTSIPSYGAGLSVLANAVNDTDVPSIQISDCRINNNYGSATIGGLYAAILDHTSASQSLIIERTTSSNNTSDQSSGMYVDAAANPSLLDLTIDAVTVADNTTTPTVAAADPNVANPSYNSGFQFNVKNLNPQMNLTNVTVANNSTVNTVDNHYTIAGFYGLLVAAPELIRVVNTTVVGNNVTQTTLGPLGKIPAFFLIKVTFDGGGSPIGVATGGSSQNGLVAHNLTNGTPNSCRSDLDGSAFGLGIFDGTPNNNGTNLSDDQTCTGYTYSPGLYDTIEHEVADNGGPVPTIKLLPGSPAINGGSAVLGISTDARGVVRTGFYSVGAYQGVLAANTNVPSGGGTLANTGVIAISSIVLLGLIIGSALFIYSDYRAHKKPLIAADPNVQYNLSHHLKVVTIPLLKYRLSIGLKRNYASDQITKF